MNSNPYIVTDMTNRVAARTAKTRGQNDTLIHILIHFASTFLAMLFAMIAFSIIGRLYIEYKIEEFKRGMAGAQSAKLNP